MSRRCTRSALCCCSYGHCERLVVLHKRQTPISLQVAWEHLDAPVAFEAATKEATIHLAAMCQNLAKAF